MTNFPIKVRYLDKNEVKIVQTPQEIEKYRDFVVEETQVQWGRKSVVKQSINNGEDYE